VRHHLADELVPQHEVAVLVVQEPARTVVRHGVGMVHEVHVRRADRGAERAQQQVTGSRHRVGRLAHLQPSAS
jgi:hypothetical protein